MLTGPPVSAVRAPEGNGDLVVVADLHDRGDFFSQSGSTRTSGMLVP